jgi:transcription elongation GreA/GreB family factor
MGSGDAATVWTEFRVISRKDVEEAAISTATTTSAEYAMAHPADVPADSNENIVEIGDRVQVQISEDARVRVITLTADRHDPDLGMISAQPPSGAVLLGAEEDEEIEFEIDNKPRHWMVVKIEKARAFATA